LLKNLFFLRVRSGPLFLFFAGKVVDRLVASR